MGEIKLWSELSKIPGIGPKFITKLSKLGIKTVKDLLWHFPFRYEDYSQIVPIAELGINQSATIQGRVHQLATHRSWKRKFIVTEAVIIDSTGGIKAVWFNQPYVQNVLKEGGYYNFAGKVVVSNREVYLASPSYEPIGAAGGGETKHTAGLIPVYPETRGLTSKGLRYLIKPILNNLEPIDDFIPVEIRKKYKLSDINIALRRIHFPLQLPNAEAARRRFAFEDLFLLQLNNLKYRSELARKKSFPIAINFNEVAELITEFPFQLTNSQKQCLQEILSDLQKSQPMSRLLQGDVGSGKTIIAAIAGILAARNGFQTAFMAPTEVLAGQHYRTITKFFSPPGGEFDGGIALLTANSAEINYGADKTHKLNQSGKSNLSKTKLIRAIADGEVKIIIGTHALIQKKVSFHNLALAVVDEQHRFGVRQRAALAAPASALTPHFLSMSATPIPRTLSLTIFGDLDFSTITELPTGRKTILTKIVAPENRLKAYQFIREQIKKGRQAFVICPRIEPSQNSDSHKSALLWEVKSVKEEFEKLSEKIFPDLRVAMLHGKMNGKEKNLIMKDFQERKRDVLVSTSVIEVGVDVPNATIMMIEGAERFGLAQLYQFRGRVGRGSHQSFCLLFTDSGAASKRLNYLLAAKNGFELAEKDLMMRGPGQFFGENQAGLPDVAMDALKDIQLVKASRDAAKEILSNDPEFDSHLLLAERFRKFQKETHLE